MAMWRVISFLFWELPVVGILFFSSVAVSADATFCQLLVAHYGITSELLRQFGLERTATAISLASPELKSKMIRAARADIRGGLANRTYNDEGRALRSIYRLWLLGVPFSEIQAPVLSVIRDFIEFRVVPGEQDTWSPPEWFFETVFTDVSEAEGIATAKLDGWTKHFRPFFDLRPDPLSPAVEAINDVSDPEYLASLYEAIVKSKQLRLEKQEQYETWGYAVSEAAQIAIAVGAYPEANRLLRYLVRLRDWDHAREIAVLLKDDEVVFNLAMVQLAEVSARLAVGKTVDVSSLFSAIRLPLASAVETLGWVYTPRLKKNAERILRSLAVQVTSAEFLAERQSDVSDWSLRDEIDYFALALEAMRLTGTRTGLRYRPGLTPNLVTRVTEPNDRVSIGNLSDRVALEEAEIIPVADTVINALVATSDVARLRRMGAFVYAHRKTGKHHIPESYYQTARKFLTAAGDIDGNYQPAIAVVDMLIEVGVTGSAGFRLSGTDTSLIGIIRHLNDQGLMSRYTALLEAQDNRYLLGRIAAAKNGGAMDDQEELYPFNPRVPNELRSVVVDEAFRPIVLLKWQPDPARKESELAKARAAIQHGHWRSLASLAIALQDISLLRRAGDELTAVAERGNDVLAGSQAFNCYATASILEHWATP